MYSKCFVHVRADVHVLGLKSPPEVPFWSSSTPNLLCTTVFHFSNVNFALILGLRVSLVQGFLILGALTRIVLRLVVLHFLRSL